jgi:anaerobic magnesium-protoporphyrin IX monomethyl ester cyclase
MRVLLVGAELEENLANRYVASSLERAGHQVQLAPFGAATDAQAVVDCVRAQSPDWIGLSMTFQRRAHEFGALADTVRAHGFAGHITCGGHFPTFAYRELLQRYRSIDTVVRHEGEQAAVQLCDWMGAGSLAQRRGELLGLAYREPTGEVVCNAPRPLTHDLDALPFPKRVGEPQVHLGIPTAFVVGSRGCYGNCTFCCIHAYISDAGGPKYRARSVDNIADEIAQLRATRGARMFVFHDDDFFTRDHQRDLVRVTALRDALWAREVRDIALVVKARPDDVHPDVFAVLQQIGLLRIYLGIEAGCTQGLRTLGRAVDVQTNRRALELMRKLDVYTCYNMLIFDPDTTPEALSTSLAFWREYSDIPMNFCRTEVYVGTPLMRRLAREGRLVGDVFGWDYEISSPPVERTLRIFARAFHDRNFRCDGLMNSNLGLGYHLHLLRHFYPHAYSPAIRVRTHDVIRSVNLDCIDRMQRILAFSQTEPSEHLDAYEAFTEQLTRETQQANHRLEEQVTAATSEILKAARECKVRATPLWKSVAAATLALSPLACPSQQQGGPGTTIVDPPPPPDPVPVPTGVYVIDQDAGQPSRQYAVPPPDRVPQVNYPPPDPPPPPTTDTAVIPPMDPPPPPRMDAGRTYQNTNRHPPPPPDPLPSPHRR